MNTMFPKIENRVPDQQPTMHLKEAALDVKKSVARAQKLIHFFEDDDDGNYIGEYICNEFGFNDDEWNDFLILLSQYYTPDDFTAFGLFLKKCDDDFRKDEEENGYNSDKDNESENTKNNCIKNSGIREIYNRLCLADEDD